MKILLTMNLPYTRVHGGANKSNRCLAEGLARRGHRVRVVVPALATPSRVTVEQVRAELKAEGVGVETFGGADDFKLDGVEVHSVAEPSRLRGHLLEQIRSFRPDWILVSSEDQSQNLLAAAVKERDSRVVYLAHTPQMFPFGPYSLYPGKSRTELVGRAAAIVTISKFVGDYVRQWTGFEVFTNHPPHFGAAPFPYLADFDNPYVTLMNASAIKGLPIFLDLAKAFPAVRFAALTGYGTTDSDRAELDALPNVTILKNHKNLDDILRQTRILLMPSLWVEGFGMAVVDAMLRGVPVLASNFGGLTEAKLGTDYLLPVRPISEFRESLNDNMLPAPVVPSQDVRPWADALAGLLGDRELYARQSMAAREASVKFVSGLSVEPLERLLQQLLFNPRPVKSQDADAPAVSASARGNGKPPAPTRPAAAAARPQPPAGAADSGLPKNVAELTPEQRAFLLLRLRQKNAHRGPQNEGADAIAPVERGRSLPLSFGQQQFWFVEQMEPGQNRFNLPAVIRLKGRLDVKALESTLTEVVRRHEVLRTHFDVGEDGQPVQVISPPPREVPLRVTDLSHVEEAVREREAQRLISAEVERPFDLSTGPLLRVELLRLSDDEHVALFTMHHIVSDGWSVGVLIREVAALYEAFTEGRPSPLPPLPLQYADFAVWQREHLKGEELERQLSYWRRQLEGAPAVLELPADKPRPPVRSYRGSFETFTLDKRLGERLGELGRGEGATLFMVLLAAFQALLYRYTGQSDIVVGANIANRNRSETEKLIGFFVNTLVLRTAVSGDLSFSALLGQVRRTCLDAYAHQDMPFVKLVEELQPARSMSHAPLFQVAFVLQNAPAGALELPGLKLSMQTTEGKSADYDLTLDMTESEQGIRGTLEYCVDLFEAPTIRRMVGHFKTLLEAAAADAALSVSSLPLLTEGESRELLLNWNDTSREFPSGDCLHRLFERRARLTPHAPALSSESGTLTYSEVDGRADGLAARLRSLGVGPDRVAALLLGRSPEMVVSMLAVLKAGGAYLPLDPAHPPQRLAALLSDSSSALLVTRGGLTGRVPGSVCPTLLLDEEPSVLDAEARALPAEECGGAAATPDNLAYVIYTSGSTGTPKGVMIPHRAVVNHLFATKALYGLGPSDRVLQFAPLSFDVAVEELYPTWGAGGCVVLRTEESAETAESFFGLLRREGVTAVNLPTAFWAEMVEQARRDGLSAPAGLRVVIAGSDVGRREQFARAREFVGAGVRLLNAYGPTETTVTSTTYELEATDGGTEPEAGVMPIGRPIANTRLYVLDGEMRPVPVGVSGELYIGGDGLARGYLKRPALTAERFVPDAFSGEAGARLYKTGDVVRYDAGGRVEFVGRADEQVKVRGFRVELGEVEAVLSSHGLVREAVAVAREAAGGVKRVVGYVVAESGASLTASELREYMRERVPEYMIPSYFVTLDRLPLTPNGKVDKRALPEPEAAAEQGDAGSEPRTPLEELVAGLWSEVLGVGGVGPESDFFESGGHSLLATQAVSRLRRLLGVEVALRELFEHPTPRRLALRLDELLRESKGIEQAPPMVAVERGGPLPLSFAQRRLWFIQQMEPESTAYNVPAAVRLTGCLNVEALESTLTEVVRRHEVLRTHFAVGEDGEPVQVVSEPSAVMLDLVDLGALDEQEREAEVQRLAREEAELPFDLSTGPLLRARLLRLSEEEHVVLLTMHHIVSDGWSVGVLIKEVAALYEAYGVGGESPLEELSIQYADFAVWQREYLKGEALERQLSYWRKRLSGSLPVLELPTDKPRPPLQTYRGAFMSVPLPEELGGHLKSLSRREGCTLFMTLLAAFQTLLHRYTGQEDIVVGSAVANRNRGEIEPLIGFFINMLALRVDLSGDPSFKDLLKRVRETALGAYAHQDVPLEKLVEEFAPKRETNHTPLFQVAFGVQNAPSRELRAPGLRIEPLAVETETGRFDLTLWIVEEGDRLTGNWSYNTDIFEAARVRRMVAHFETLLRSVVAAPEARLSELSMLSEEERLELAARKKGREEANAKSLKAARRKAVSATLMEAQATASAPPAEERAGGATP